QAEDGIRDRNVTGVQTCALPISSSERFDQAAPISARPTKTRWLGALSLEELTSATMRTPLAFRLRVTISPWKSLPTFLKEPMVEIGRASCRERRDIWVGARRRQR